MSPTVEINPLIKDVTIGSAYAAIDCVALGCLESVEIRISMKEHEIFCNILKGPAGYLRYDARGEITLNPINFTMANLAAALDASVGTTTGNIPVTGEAHYPTWVPDDAGTPTEWTAVISLANSEIVESSVGAWDDEAQTQDWDAEVTNTLVETALCAGTITLTTTDLAETLSTIYFGYSYGTQIPSGSSIIEPSFASFAADHKVTVVHKHAMTNDYIVHKVWRAQTVPDFAVTFQNQAREVIAPVRLKIVEDSANHPDSPLGVWIKIDSGTTEFDYEPYLSVPGTSLAA